MPRKSLDNENAACQATVPGINHAPEACRLFGMGDACIYTDRGSLSRKPLNKCGVSKENGNLRYYEIQ
jgi:hypothetical protein